MLCCREPFSGFSHLVGAILMAVGLAVLVVLTHSQPGKMISMLIYGFSVIILYCASSVLHLVRVSPFHLQWLSRIDHAAIYGMIAGSFTPFGYNLLTGFWRWGLLGLVWSIALVAIVYKLAYHKRRTSGKRGVLAYIGMGWLGVVALPKFYIAVPLPCIGLVFISGLIYSVGAWIYSFDDPCCRPRYFNMHDLWHLFVLAGSLAHFIAVLIYIV
jgi:hemolysin III